MYDARTLKQNIHISRTQVECPVVGCSQKVVRQRGVFKRDIQFQCPEHQIYISPSTFEYPSDLDNLLWKDGHDIPLLANIKLVKRECRMARDNSEDALTWNVFRYLDKANCLSDCLALLAGQPLRNLELVYWSYSDSFHGVLPDLIAARQEFGEQPQRSSEPDLIALNDDAIFFIEAKLTASNETTPSDPHNLKKYLVGGNQWYQQVCKSDYDTIANVARKYELLRFWLLGSWIGALRQRPRHFYLLNLVRSGYEQEIEALFVPLVKTDTNRRFVRATWEAIHQFIADYLPSSNERNRLLNYLENKTVGYNRFGELQRAFSIRHSILADINGS